MKTLKTPRLALVCAAAFLVALAGCSSTPEAKDAKTTATFPHPIAKVQQAAVDALTVTGFDIKKQEPTYVEGTRPRKMGLFVGSGGETVGVWLTALSPEQTEVKVDTAKTFVGGAGQKSWDKQVLEEMTKSLAP